jgi:hypothetical protein
MGDGPSSAFGQIVNLIDFRTVLLSKFRVTLAVRNLPQTQDKRLPDPAGSPSKIQSILYW